MPSKLDDYDVLYTIGSGSYGKCRKVRRKNDAKILVSKEIDYGTMSEAEKQMLVSEVNLLRELKHERIVRYYDRIVDRTTSTIYIIMEYCEGGDLGSLISKCKKDRKYLEESFVWKIFRQLTEALQECHRRGKGRAILHRDLKPANVFLDADHDVKLGDFGLARVLQHDTSFAKTFVGTPYYMSPEQMNRMSYNDKSDIWSLGCLIYELASLSPPFTALNQAALAVKIKNGQFRRLPAQYSNDLNEIIISMLKVKSACRPSIDELLTHPKLSCVASKDSPKKVDEEDLSFENSACRPSIDELLTHPKLSCVTSKDSPKKVDEEDLKKQEESLKKREESLRKQEEAIKLREKRAEERERRQNEKQQELELREKAAAVKERLASEKLSRAEELLQRHQAQIPKGNARVTELRTQKDFTEDLYPSNLKAKKRVHFLPGKENRPSQPRNTGTDVKAPSSQGNKGEELKERLYQAKLRGVALRQAEITSKFKSKQLLNMR